MANKKIAGITVEIGADTTKLGKALSDVEKDAKNIRTELREVNNALKLDPTNTELLTQKQQLLADAINNAKNKLDTLRNAQQQVSDQFAKGEIDEGQYRAFQREIINAENELTRLQNDSEETTSTVESNTQSMATGFMAVGTAISEVGDKLMPVTEKIVDFAKQSYGAWTETYQGYETIITKTGATGEALEELNDVANNIFTSMPMSMSDVGTAVGEVNTRFGLTGDALEDLSTKFLKFADINGTNVNSSIDNVSASAKAFNLNADETAQLLDVLTAVGQQTGIDMSSLESTMSSNATVFKEMGLSASESAQLLGQFEINGVDTATALSSLKKAQQNAASEGKSLKDVLKSAMGSIRNTADETYRMNVATELFGKKGAAQMSQAIREGRFSLDSLSDSMESYAGVTDATFEETQTASDQLTTSVNAVKLSMSELASTALDALQPCIDKVKDVISQLAEKFRNLTDEQKETIIKMLAVVAAIAPLLSIVGSVITAIGTVITVVQTLTPIVQGLFAVLSANPIGIVIAAIVGLIAIIVELYKHSESFRNFINDAFDSFKVGIKICVDFFKSAVESWKTGIKIIIDFFKNAVDSWKTGIKAISDFFKNAVDNWKSGINAIKDAFSNAWEGIKAVWSKAVDFFSGVRSGINDAFSNVGTWFQNKFSDAFDKIKAVFSGIRGFFEGIWDTIKDVFGGVGTKIGDAFGGAFKSVVNTIFEWIESRINEFFDVINGAIDFINEIPGVEIGKVGHVSLPRLAKGGVLSEGSAIVAEAGPELLSVLNGKVTVTPLTHSAQNTATGNAATTNNYYQTNNIQAVINNDMDIRSLSQKLSALNRQTAYGRGV